MEARLTFMSVALAATLMTSGCSDNAAIKGGGEKKPAQSNVIAAPSGDVKLSAKPLAKARYNMQVFKHYDVPESKMSICNGVVTITIWSDFGGLAPQGVIDCLMFGKMDLSKMIPKPEELEEIDLKEMKQYKGFGKLTRLPNPKSGSYKFSPPMPMILGPLIQDASVYKDFVFKEDKMSISMTHPEKGQINDVGSVYYKVLSEKMSFSPEGTNITFDNVIHYERTVDGFANTPDRGLLMLYGKMEFWFNTQPIAIPQLLIRTMPSQMGGFAGAMAAIGDAVLGPLTIQLTLISHTQL